LLRAILRPLSAAPMRLAIPLSQCIRRTPSTLFIHLEEPAQIDRMHRIHARVAHRTVG